MPIKRLLTQNSELKPHGIYNWTLPAFGVRLTDGTTMNVCPQAGACAAFCYARNGTYNFRNVKARHIANLEYTINDPDGWQNQMTAEVQHHRMRGKHVRIHDSGDFYSADYLNRWLTIVRSTTDVTFYCYTKEVALFKQHVTEDLRPNNFRYLFSLGGKQDHMIDLNTDRHADVFPDDSAILAAGYQSQDASDLLAITLPTNRIGIPANRIPHYNRKLAGRTFSQAQRDRDSKRGNK